MTLFFCISSSDLEDSGMKGYKSPGAPSPDLLAAGFVAEAEYESVDGGETF
jgi:hypothetical protein